MCTYSFTPAPPPAPPHPPSSPCHIVTHTTLVTQVRVVAVDRSDSFRSTVHNVQTPCRPLRTQQGGRVRGLQCLSCHMHTIRRPPGPSHPPPYRSFVHTLLCVPLYIRSLLPLPLLLPIHPLPVTSSHTPHLSRRDR